MFRKNKIEKEYIRRTENLQIPKINGEQFIKIESTENRNKFQVSKYMVRVVCICTIFVFSTVGISYYNSKNSVESNVISTAFGIKAYAATTNGTESVDLVENQKVELPSAETKNGGFNMKGLEINGDKKIKDIKASCTNGSVSIKSARAGEVEFDMVELIGNNSVVGMAGSSFGANNTDTIKYVGDEVIKIITEKMQNGESVDEDIKKIENGEYNDLIKKDIENNSAFFTSDSGNNSLDLDVSNEDSKFTISWIPEIEALKELSQGMIDDYSKLEGDSIKIQVTFEDGTVKENILNLSFSKEGNIIFELK